MTDPLRHKKREGWLGLVLTAVLCLGFLYWWFRPARETWQPHTTAQLVARALAEPGLEDPAARLVLDFDLMEVAILQGRLAMVPESLQTAARIADPIVQARTIRQLAQAQLNHDAKNLGDALTMCGRIGNLELRGRMRDEIVLQIAMMGFADVVLPEARTPLMRARLARCLAQTDGQDTARTLLTEGEGALAGLPPDQAAAVRLELAWTRVNLSLADGPAQAFPAIEAQPEGAVRGELLLELFRFCFGRGSAAEDCALVLSKVADPALRRRMELEALQSNIPLRPVEEILTELQAAFNAAPAGSPEQVRVLMDLADTRVRSAGPEAAAKPLRTALEAAKSLGDPARRAPLLAELVEMLPEALLFDEAKQALSEAVSAARAVAEPETRLPLLIQVLSQAFNAGDFPAAAGLAEESLALVPKVRPVYAQLDELADFLTRLGDWPAALSLPGRLPPADPAQSEAGPVEANKTAEANRTAASGAAAAGAGAPAPPQSGEAPVASTDPAKSREALLESIATTAAEDMIGYDQSAPPPRGEPMDRIRHRAVTDEVAAASYLPGIPAGFLRARATLALAKGLLLPPLPVLEASMAGGLPGAGDEPADNPPPDPAAPDGGANDLPPGDLMDDESSSLPVAAPEKPESSLPPVLPPDEGQ